jgi:hypothetical protein
MSGPSPYRDPLGRTKPGPGIAGPDHVYVGNLHRGRVAIDTLGRRLKIVSQSEGSTTVARSAPGRSFRTADGKDVAIRGGREVLTLARGAVVLPANRRTRA